MWVGINRAFELGSRKGRVFFFIKIVGILIRQHVFAASHDLTSAIPSLNKCVYFKIITVEQVAT